MPVTVRAQRPIHGAKVEDHRLGHGQVGPEHLLLAPLGDRQCLAAAAFAERGSRPGPPGAGWRRPPAPARATAGPGRPTCRRPPPAHDQFVHRRARPGRAGGDRAGTRPARRRAPVPGVDREGDDVAAQVLEDLGAGLLQLREPVVSVYRPGRTPSRSPRTGARRRRSRRPGPGWAGCCRWPRASAAVGRHPGPAVAGALVGLVRPALRPRLRHPGAGGRPARPSVLGHCEISDRAGTGYANGTPARRPSAWSDHQRPLVPAPPPGTELLELGSAASTPIDPDAPPLVVSTSSSEGAATVSDRVRSPIPRRCCSPATASPRATCRVLPGRRPADAPPRRRAAGHRAPAPGRDRPQRLTPEASRPPLPVPDRAGSPRPTARPQQKTVPADKVTYVTCTTPDNPSPTWPDPGLHHPARVAQPAPRRPPPRPAGLRPRPGVRGPRRAALGGGVPCATCSTSSGWPRSSCPAGRGPCTW